MNLITLAAQNVSIHILEAAAPVTTMECKLLPVVFVHGMACSADLWDEQLAYAARTRRAIAIDLRGHGASSPPEDDDYSPASCAADLLAVLEALGLEHIALVGHSFGACVALAAAAAKPNAIAQLVLVDPPIDCTQCPPEVYEAQIAPMQAALATDGWRSVLEDSFRNALAGGTSATQDQILARLAATPKDRLLGTSRGLFAFKALEALDEYLASPGARAHAILAPSNNSPFSLHVLRPALTTITLPATGHWLMLDAPEPFATALDTCLAAV
ncbi:alpha/beta hydrolase [Coleofasciculus sp. FACHB-129]|uniref:alpha/beta fold hydrolase n=1 Tax=Cyanophyceae TaxID=3028117 RepID=UPI001689F9A3|nr:alpha/beta hydrolase [Coleofasciculus sp. FACHB-129]MBD1898338.1 alpha/beta hydrolase [Coleofasciculus sp. FACHB-129]